MSHGQPARPRPLRARGGLFAGRVTLPYPARLCRPRGDVVARAPFDPAWLPAGDALVVPPALNYIAHSNQSVSWGTPVQQQRADHPIFNVPNPVSRAEMMRWNDISGFQEATVVAGADDVPLQSPAAMTLALDTTADDAGLHARNKRFRQASAILGSRGMGLQHNAALDMTSSSGSVALFIGFGLVGRIDSDPVAVSMLANVVEYGASASRSQPLHPAFSAGETVTWGNYASEKGLVTSNDNGLLVKPCSFDPGCRMGDLGNVPCGRQVFGPWNWTYMAHNTDQRPQSSTGSGSVWLTLMAGVSSARTTFGIDDTRQHGLAAASPTVPTMTVTVLDSTNFQPTARSDCAVESSSTSTVVVTCKVQGSPAGVPIELGFTADKKSAKLLTTAFV